MRLCLSSGGKERRNQKEPVMRRSVALPLASRTALACSDRSSPTGPASPNLPRLSADIATASTSGYTAIDLGTLGGGEGWAVDINDAGQVVGVSRVASGEEHLFLWQEGAMLDLGCPTGLNYCWQWIEINESGQVLVYTHDYSISGAYLWADGQWTTVSSFFENPNVRNVTVEGFNEAGQVLVSEWDVRDGSESTYIWANGEKTYLINPESPHFSPSDLNNAGQAVGNIFFPQSVARVKAVLWHDGVWTDLGAAVYSNWAHLLNDVGQVVGQRQLSAGDPYYGYFWDNGVITDFPLACVPHDINDAGQVLCSRWTERPYVWESGTVIDIDLGTRSWVNAMNEAGQVVGAYEAATGYYGFLWEDGAMTRLDALEGMTESWTNAVNDKGHAVGGSLTASGEYHAVLWRPLTPVEQIDQLVAMVQQLIDEGEINHGQGNSLINKLNIATAMLNDGKTGPAINKIDAFINQLEGFMCCNDDPVIPPAKGQPIVGKAQDVIDQLGG
jgi:probable HAF family extracellular repeat protein